MREVFDFSDAQIRCSATYYIVAQGKERTPKEKYEFYTTVLREEMAKYDGMSERQQGMANGLKKAAKIAGLEYELKQLEPKRFDDPLPQGAKSYLKRLYGELKYGKWSASNDKGNKFTEKGKIAEPAAIELINFLDGSDCFKNQDRFSNEFITGHPDVICIKDGCEYLIDVKTSWDWETFAENIGKPLNPLYWWQLQAYFDVKHINKGEVSYCLVDTPEEILNDERYRLAKRMKIIDETPEYRLAEAKMINNMTFSDIPAIERRLKFCVDRDDAAIQKIHDKVPLCRDYLFEIQEMHLTGYFTDKELPMLETIEEI